jgi:hypothetical protein
MLNDEDDIWLIELFAISLNLNFWILPLAVAGNSLT